jgi:hypothetical protein
LLTNLKYNIKNFSAMSLPLSDRRGVAWSLSVVEGTAGVRSFISFDLTPPPPLLSERGRAKKTLSFPPSFFFTARKIDVGLSK